MNSIRDLLKKNTPLFIDGAMGTMLQSLGIPSDVNPAEYCMEHPEIVRKVHTAYIEAGADIILSATFGGTKYKLPSSMDVVKFNKTMVENARQVADELQTKVNRPLFVAGDIGPVGQFLKPLGDMEPEDFVNAIREQVRGLVQGGVDLIFIETQFDLGEVRAAVAAAKMECDLPIFVSMTFENGVSLTGTRPDVYAATMENLGVDAIGVNCGCGPDFLLAVVEKIVAHTSLPVFAEPNAGLPELIDGETVFRLPPAPFAEQTLEIAKAGATILGGCCGTTPEHIKALREMVLANRDESYNVERKIPKGVRLTSRALSLNVGQDSPSVLVGHTVTPDSKVKLHAQLLEGDMDLLVEYAEELVDFGVSVLDVNASGEGLDEAKVMPQMVEGIITRFSKVLSFNAQNADAIVKTLAWFPGSALVHHVDCCHADMEKIVSACKLWGCPFVIRPQVCGDAPQHNSERILLLEKMLQKLEEMAIPKKLIIVDVRAFSVNDQVCLASLAWCRERGLATSLELNFVQ